VEFLAQNHPVPVKMIGVNDRFGSSGKPEVLMKEYGLVSDTIVDAVKKLLR